ncbi:MAG: SpoIIE family protein phosphatase [Candidatus Latescibacteria bacterium]|nr:SpoIIE family protein phosphatase [Candidatus Latescibacterota bacterium]
MAPDIPFHASLRIRKCFADALSVWASNIPILFAASVVAFGLSMISGTLLMGSLYAGMLLMTLRGLQGQRPNFRDLFGQVRRFPRFFSITVFIMLFFILGLVLIAVPLFLQSDIFAALLTEFSSRYSQETDLIIAYGPEDIVDFLKAKDVILVTVLITFSLLFLPGLFFVIKCFYMYLLVADRGVRLDEAYVESRKAVEKYGFWKHVLLTGAAFGVLVCVLGVVVYFAPESDVHILFLLAFAPFSCGLFASAYEQTLGEEARQWKRYMQQFAEMRDELQTAHDMQVDLLPPAVPDLVGYDLSGQCIPANSVGGDYYAYRWLNKEKTKLGIVVADVSGKGMLAAVTALRFNEMLRYECEGRIEPAEILDGLNTSLEGQIDLSTFITCCVAVLDVPTGDVQVASAGHCPPVLVDETAELIDLSGYPLGLPKIVRPDEPYETEQFTLSPGARLVLYSDGVVEAQNKRRQLYDDDRFLRLLERTGKDVASKDLIEKAVSRVVDFIGDAPRTDDITMVILQREVS